MSSRLILSFVLGVAALFYGLTLRGVVGNPDATAIKNRYEKAASPFESSSERGRYALIYNLAHRQSFSLTQPWADVSNPDVGYHEGRFYIFFPPGVSLLSLPFFLFGARFELGQVAAYATVPIFATFTLLFLFLIGRRILKLSAGVSVLAVLVYAFASTSWSYAVTLFQHHITAFLMISSFYAAWHYKKGRKHSALAAVYVFVAYALAIFVDYPNAVLMLPVMAYFFLTSVGLLNTRQGLRLTVKPVFVVALSIFLAATGMHAYYNRANFGSPLRLSGSLAGYKEIKELEKDKVGKKTKEELIREELAGKGPSGFFSEEKLPRGLYTLLLAPDKGLLFFSPIFLLGIWGAISAASYNTNREKYTLFALGLTNIFLYSSFGDPWGGWAYGPRYLIPAMAVLSLMVGYWLENWRHLWLGNAVFLLLFSYSAAVSLLGVLTSNLLPPGVEANFLDLRYGFGINVEYLLRGLSGSFAYNSFLRGKLTLLQYYLLLYFLLMGIVVSVFAYLRRHDH